MLQSPVKKIYVTQKFGVNRQNYSQFGYLGHNGIDFRAFLPNGERCYVGGKSEVFLPHSGQITVNAFDVGGYGYYIKIGEGYQTSILAHFSERSPLKVGEFYQAGTFCGYQGTSGNSSGIHLHWGWYRNPRNSSNGYGGYQNQDGLYKEYSDTITPVDKDTTNALKILEATKIEFDHSNLEGTADAGRGAQKDAKRNEATIKTLQEANENLTKSLNAFDNELLELGEENKLLIKKNEELKSQKPVFSKRIPQLLLELAYAFEG